MKITKYLSLALAAMTLAFTSCEPDKPEWKETTLAVQSIDGTDITTLTFDAVGGEQTFNVVTNRSWTASCKEEWVSVTPEKVDNAQSADKTTAVKVTLLANEGSSARSAALTITADDKKATLTINQAAEGQVPVGDVLFSDNFDKKVAEKEGTAWPELSDEYSNPAPAAQVSVVEYDATNITVRSNSTSDSSYSDYKGSGSNNLFFGKAPASLIIKKISLEGITGKALTLTFGTERYSQDAGSVFDKAAFKVYVSGDGTKWTPINYTFADGANLDGRWNLATAGFSLKEVPASLSIAFYSTVASAHRLDDVTLTDGGGGAEVDLSTGGALGEGGGGGDDPDPELTETTIAAINESATTTKTDIGNYFVKAVVTSDFAGGNYASGNLMVMTKGATTAGNGIMVYLYQGDFTAFAFGDEVKIDCSAAKSQKYNKGTGAYCNEIIITSVDAVTKTGNNYASEITPVIITPDQIEAFQGMVVGIEKSQAKDTSIATWAGNTTTFVSNSVEYPVYVQGTATSIVGQPFLTGVGTLKGIAYVYGGGGTAQICPRNYDDVADLTEGAVPQSSLAVTPATLSWEADDTAAQTITVTAKNADDSKADSWEATVSGDAFTLTNNKSAGTISVAPKAANASSAAVTATVTVTFDGKTKTVTLSQSGKPVEGATTVTMTYADIVAGKAEGSEDLASNGYGSQAVDTPSTWYNWTVDGVKFTGVKICQGAGTGNVYVGYLQQQGNATDAPKQGIIGNVESLGEIQSITIVAVNSNSAYTPSASFYFGTEAQPAGNKIAADGATEKSTATDGSLTVFTYKYDVAGKGYSFFKIANDTQGAMYYKSISIVYKK